MDAQASDRAFFHAGRDVHFSPGGGVEGLSAVEISPNVGRQDTTLHLIYAFLLLCYGDSTQEEITVPMVHHDGRWLMK